MHNSEEMEIVKWICLQMAVLSVFDFTGTPCCASPNSRDMGIGDVEPEKSSKEDSAGSEKNAEI
jgi:hypothetical protein